MEDRAVEQRQHHLGQGQPAHVGLALEERDVLGQQDDQPFLEQEKAERRDPEQEIVAGGVVLGPLEDQGDVLRLEFQAREFVGVQGRIQGVLVQLQFLGQVFFFGVAGIDVDQDRALFILAFHDLAVGQFIASHHAATSPVRRTLIFRLRPLAGRNIAKLIIAASPPAVEIFSKKKGGAAAAPQCSKRKRITFSLPFSLLQPSGTCPFPFSCHVPSCRPSCCPSGSRPSCRRPCRSRPFRRTWLSALP